MRGPAVHLPGAQGRRSVDGRGVSAVAKARGRVVDAATLAWTLLLPAVPLGAQVGAAPGAAGADSTAVQEQPFVEGGQFDKPYLTTLLGRIVIGGYAEAHARYEREDGVKSELGFEAKRFNLFVSSPVSDFVRFGAELEFEEGAEEIKLEFATVDLTIHPSLAFRAGMLLSPLGRFNLSHDSPLNAFTDRPVVATEILGVALSEPGLGVLGALAFGGGTARVTYELYAVNGFHSGLIESSPEGTRIPEGKGAQSDGNSSPAFVGRVAVTPRVGWELGLSAHHGAWNDFEEEGLEVDRRRNLTIGVLDFGMEAYGVSVRGELAAASIDLPPGLRGLYQAGQRGFFLEGVLPFGMGWVPTMPSSTFNARVRLEAVDFDSERGGDSVRQVSAGVGFRPTPETALKLDYVRGRSFDRFENPADHARILLSVATYF